MTRTRKLFYLLFVALLALPLAAQEKKEPAKKEPATDAIIELKMPETMSEKLKRSLLERIESREQAGLPTEEEQAQLASLEFVLASTEVAMRAQMTTKVYALKDRNKDVVAKLITEVARTGEQVEASIDQKLKTITVSSTEKGHDRIMKALWQYDYPSPPVIELQFYLVKATSSGTGLKNGLPKKVHRALDEVAALTLYKGFELVDAPFVRVEGSAPGDKPGGGGTTGSVFSDLLSNFLMETLYTYDISVSSVSLGDSAPQSENGKRTVRLGNFSFNMSAYNESQFPFPKFNTSLTIPEGDMVVIGASSFHGAAQMAGGKDEENYTFIIIATARIL
jgi:hypothetical protein